jgi:hypothetical protein
MAFTLLIVGLGYEMYIISKFIHSLFLLPTLTVSGLTFLAKELNFGDSEDMKKLVDLVLFHGCTLHPNI